MSATLVARGVSGGHPHQVLFTDLDLVVAPGDVLGLVGPNGAGKTTLLRLLAGLDEPLAGTITRSPPTATVGYLPQEVERRPGETVAAHVLRRTGVSAAQARLEAATAALAAGERGAEDVYQEALDQWLSLGAADAEERLEAVLAELGLVGPDGRPATDLPMTALSGGQAARAGLAVLLTSRFDLVLLDEPTNDLDLEGLARLEQFVGDLRTGAVIVSHDREFLARTVTDVVELDPHEQRAATYHGGYDAYLEERRRARQRAEEAYETYVEQLSTLQERARRQRQWMEKGVRNARRKQSDPDKFIVHRRAEASEKQAAKARQTERAIERLDPVEQPWNPWELRYSVAAAPRGSAVAVRARGAVAVRGDFRLGPVDLQVDAGDRIAVTGPNGAGKSTLLALLLGRLEPFEGDVTIGPSVAIGEVDQARRQLLGDEPLVEAVHDRLPDLDHSGVRSLLAKFGLTAEHVTRPAASLSPGERTRAALALLQARGVNLLVLDEPTNHLDLPAIEQLEQALDDYDGTLLLVTHDRRMLAAVRTTRRWHVDAGRVTETLVG